MPNIKSAEKRVKVIRAKTLQNQIIKSSLKTVLKKFDVVLSEGNKSEALSSFNFAVKKLDQATAKGILHKNTASRKKSSMALKLNALDKA